jgi:hypothetical protein
MGRELVDEGPETPERLAKQIQASLIFIKDLKFDKTVLYHILCIGLFANLIERADTINLLVRSDKTFDAKAILRAMIEAMVELKCLRSDPLHLQNAKYEYYKHLSIMMNEAKRGNSYLSEMAAIADFESHLRSFEASKKEAQLAGGQAMRVADKFSKLGLRDEYEAIYRRLSSETHPTYGGLIGRQFEVDLKKQDFEVVLFGSADPQSIDLALHLARVTLQQAMDAMKGFPTHPSSTH